MIWKCNPRLMLFLREAAFAGPGAPSPHGPIRPAEEGQLDGADDRAAGKVGRCTRAAESQWCRPVSRDGLMRARR